MSLPKLFALVAAVALPLALLAWATVVYFVGPDAAAAWHLLRR
jgi:hypothetical protein